MKSFKMIGRIAVVFFMYLFVFLYAIIFTNDTGWVLVTFFALLFLVECVSLLSPLRGLKIKSPKSLHLIINEHASIDLIIKRSIKLPLYFDTLKLTFSKIQQNYTLNNYFGQEKKLLIAWQPLERGVIESQHLFLQTNDFFRLFIKRRSIVIPVEWIVLPGSSPFIDETVALLEKITNKQSHGETSYTLKNYREYREGESTKQIDWKTSSRLGTLMTREYERDEPTQWLFVFYGIESRHFEAMLSLFYTLFRTYQTPARFMLIGSEGVNSQLDSLATFATIQPATNLPEIPYRPTESVCVFVPELTENVGTLFQERRFHFISFHMKQLLVRVV